MSKPSKTSTPKISTQRPQKSAWARGPPQTSIPPAVTSTSTSPAQTHSRRSSALSQIGVTINDWINAPPRGLLTTKSNTVNLILALADDNPATTSSFPANIPPTKAEGVRPFGSVPAVDGGGEPLPSFGDQQPGPSPLKQSSSTPPTIISPATTEPVTLESAYGCLIGRAFVPHELPSLIEAICSTEKKGGVIHYLQDDAQTLIDVIDEALDGANLSPQIRKKCLKSLYRMCGRNAILPSTLKVLASYDRSTDALYRGGYADVWKGECGAQDVAVKVIRMYSTSELQKIVGRFCKEVVMWKFLRHPNVLPLIGVMMSETRFAMISSWMENGNINEFLKKNPDANRLGLLVDVTRGLMYIHSQEMVHGDLKGANILINQAGHACLADFGLLTIVSNHILSSSSYAQGGTTRWMSPELIAPSEFGFNKSCQTESSDCYALGMVIYEVISGNPPFYGHDNCTIPLMVVRELCWSPQPNQRPNINNVLQCLERVLNLPELPSTVVGQEMEKGDNWDSVNDSSDISVLTDGDSHTSPLHSHKPLVSSKSLHHTNVLSDTKRDDNPTSDGFTPILKPAKASIHDLFQGPYSSPHSIQPGPPPAHHRIYNHPYIPQTPVSVHPPLQIPPPPVAPTRKTLSGQGTNLNVWRRRNVSPSLDEEDNAPPIQPVYQRATIRMESDEVRKKRLAEKKVRVRKAEEKKAAKVKKLEEEKRKAEEDKLDSN